jgi:hypothetical protein
MGRILYKRQFYELSKAGTLGNTPRTWDSLPEILASGFTGTLAIRCIGRSVGGNSPFVTDLRLNDLPAEMEKLELAGWRPDDFVFLEQLTPDDKPGGLKYVLNGEVMRGRAVCGCFIPPKT